MPRRSIDADTAQRIRIEADRGTRHQAIARRYGVTTGTVSSIHQRTSHSRLPEATSALIERLMGDNPSAEMLDRLIRVKDAIGEIEFQLRQTRIPAEWQSDYAQIGEVREQLAANVGTVFDRFQKLLATDQK